MRFEQFLTLQHQALIILIWDFAPIHYLLNRKIPIYCVPLQYKFTDYLPDRLTSVVGVRAVGAAAVAFC